MWLNNDFSNTNPYPSASSINVIRNSKEFSEGKISQANHVGPDIDLCKKEISKSLEKPIIIICQNGNYSLRMAADLKKENINVFTMKGGINSWKSENLPLIS